MNIEQGLIDWGLDEKEAQIYNSLTKNVESTVYRLAQETHIPRTTIYDTLEILVRKGLVSFSRKNGVKYFFPESPNQLAHILEKKMSVAKDLIPLLLNFSNKQTLTPTVKLYLGPDGKKKVLEDILDTCKKTGDKTLFAIPGTDLYDDLPRYLVKWIKHREELGIKSQILIEDNPRRTVPNVYRSNLYRETRFISPEYISGTGVDIYSGKIAMFSKSNNIEHSVIIESPSIAETFKKFFMCMWDSAKQEKSKT